MPDDTALIASAARNHASWWVARGGTPRAHGALRWVLAPASGEAMVPFPDAIAADDADALVADCRAQGQRGIGVWTTGLGPVDATWAVLQPRGFEWGWQAHWMAFDPGAVLAADDARVRVQAGPEPSTWRALADGGEAVVHVADGAAGLYDVGVDPARQRTGLGRALVTAALRAGVDAGARVLTTNATADGEHLYAALGARSLGRGQTFWCHLRR